MGLGILILVALVGFFYKAGEYEGIDGLVTAVISLVIWFVAPRIIPLGILASLGGEVLLFIALIVYGIVRSRPSDKSRITK